MKYQFKQAVKISKRKSFESGLVNPKDQFEYDCIFNLGDHEVPKAVESDPYFLQLVQCGLVVEKDASKEVIQESASDRSKRLYDKLTSKKEEPKESEESDSQEAKSKKRK